MTDKPSSEPIQTLPFLSIVAQLDLRDAKFPEPLDVVNFLILLSPF